MKKINKEVVFITGSNGLLGSSIVNSLSSNNFNIVLGYNKSRDKIDDYLKNQSGSSNIEAIHCNLMSRSSITTAFNEIKKKFGKIDCLINNAAYTKNIDYNLSHDIDHETVEKIIATNYTGAMYCCFEFIKCVKEELKDNASIKLNKSVINILSNSIRTHHASNIIYISSKAALQSLTESLAIHYGKYVRFNSIAPGLMKSELTSDRFEKISKDIIKKTPIGKLVEPSDISNLIKMLITDMKSINGQTIYLDGGRTIGS